MLYSFLFILLSLFTLSKSQNEQFETQYGTFQNTLTHSTKGNGCTGVLMTNDNGTSWYAYNKTSNTLYVTSSVPISGTTQSISCIDWSCSAIATESMVWDNTNKKWTCGIENPCAYLKGSPIYSGGTDLPLRGGWACQTPYCSNLIRSSKLEKSFCNPKVCNETLPPYYTWVAVSEWSLPNAKDFKFEDCHEPSRLKLLNEFADFRDKRETLERELNYLNQTKNDQEAEIKSQTSTIAQLKSDNASFQILLTNSFWLLVCALVFFYISKKNEKDASKSDAQNPSNNSYTKL